MAVNKLMVGTGGFLGGNGYGNNVDDMFNPTQWNNTDTSGWLQHVLDSLGTSPSIMPTDRYAGNPYTGSEVYTPPAADPMDYWNEQLSGYDQMPEYGVGNDMVPYDVVGNYYNNLQPIDTTQEGVFGNANTYAPWSGYGPEGNAPSSGELINLPYMQGGPGRDSVDYNWGRELYIPFLPGSGAFGMKKGKKPDWDLTVPEYQGHMFTPEEGFPTYFNPSRESQELGNQSQQDLYQSGNINIYESPVTQGIQGQGYDYNYTGGGGGYAGGNPYQPQSYVGQKSSNDGSAYGSSAYNPTGTSLYQTFKPGEFA